MYQFEFTVSDGTHKAKKVNATKHSLKACS